MATGTTFRTRFAPSPTGYLHEGHAFSAHKAFSAASEAGGECLLRIEDIDQTRCRPDYEAAIYEDLHWLGFDWPSPVRRQSDHFSDYRKALSRLQKLGLTYRCFLTRKDVNELVEQKGIAVSPAGLHPFPAPESVMSEDEIQSRLARRQSFVWRLSLPACRDYLGEEYDRLSFIEEGDAPGAETGEVKARPDWLGDVVLERKDVPTSYHMAVCHDDHFQGITHVIRGVDLYHATHIHVLLQALLGYAQPIYRHHGLIMDETEKKMSKSRGSKSLRDLRGEGLNAQDLVLRWDRD